jgi:hypothetical protein
MGQERTRNHGVIGTTEEQKRETRESGESGDMGEWNGEHGVVTTKERLSVLGFPYVFMSWHWSRVTCRRVEL